ncbi:MAG TPA: hypothetical protein VK891_04025, partial [Euzebyales bacterium]|nr:hypothetical protein [Euzebyales bacterium]
MAFRFTRDRPSCRDRRAAVRHAHVRSSTHRGEPAHCQPDHDSGKGVHDGEGTVMTDLRGYIDVETLRGEVDAGRIDTVLLC